MELVSLTPQLNSAPQLLQISSSLFFSPTANSSRHAAPLPHENTRTSEPKLVALVVDDVPDVTEMISLFLRHAGFKVITAESAADALELAQGQVFDVVISDIGMPGMNGYELAQKLRELPDYLGVPMIAVTGYSMYDDRERALDSGFNAHLVKPIDPGALLNLINELRD